MLEPQPSRGRGVIRLIVSLVFLAAAVWVFLNHRTVLDQVTVWQYKPSNAVVELADTARLSDRGRFLLYASRAEVNERNAFNKHCAELVEKTAVLGCYANARIYIYDVTDPRLSGIKEVTTAHEMLHAAYDRLGDSERKRIDRLIDSYATTITDQALKDRLTTYDKIEPGQRINELHSILGTEIAKLPNDLEEYYRQYFSNRSVIVGLAAKYEGVFNQLEAQQRRLVSEVNALADSINSRSKKYSSDVQSLDADVSSFNARAQSGGFASEAAFNAERSRLAIRQDALGTEWDSINADFQTYQQKKTQLDSLNLQAEGLQQSVTSTMLPKAPQL